MNRIREIRKKKNESLEDVARALGISRQAIHGWETGEKNPTFDNLQALARHWGVTLDEIAPVNEKKPEKGKAA